MPLDVQKEKSADLNKDFKDLLKSMKKNESFKAIISKNKIKDEEIKAHLVDFFSLYNSLTMMHKLPIHYVVKRDENKKIYFEQVFANNKFGKFAKIKQNTWFADISEIDYEVSEKEYMNRPSREKVNFYKTKLDGFYASQNNFEGLKSFYIFGDSGTGKTFILSYFATYFALKNFKVAYIKMPKLFNFVLKELSKKSNVINDIKEKLTQVDFLFLDDLGEEKDNVWFRTEFLAQIINERFENKKPTFFASSLSTIDLEKLYYRQGENVKHIVKKMISKIVRQIEFQVKLTLG